MADYKSLFKWQICGPVRTCDYEEVGRGCYLVSSPVRYTS